MVDVSMGVADANERGPTSIDIAAASARASQRSGACASFALPEKARRSRAWADSTAASAITVTTQATVRIGWLAGRFLPLPPFATGITTVSAVAPFRLLSWTTLVSLLVLKLQLHAIIPMLMAMVKPPMGWRKEEKRQGVATDLRTSIIHRWQWLGNQIVWWWR